MCVCARVFFVRRHVSCTPQRAAWTPYFDDCDAIIFLAPISCFDEKLAEDRRVNRLEDSYQLWKTICSSKLLGKAQIILFLNKIDLRRCRLPCLSLSLSLSLF